MSKTTPTTNLYNVYILLTLNMSHTDKHFRGVIHETEVCLPEHDILYMR